MWNIIKQYRCCEGHCRSMRQNYLKVLVSYKFLLSYGTSVKFQTQMWKICRYWNAHALTECVDRQTPEKCTKKSHYLSATTSAPISDLMKMAASWTVAGCSLKEVYRHFTGTCCLDHPDYGGRNQLWNVSKLPDYTALQTTIQPSSYSLPQKPQISYQIQYFFTFSQKSHHKPRCE